jgi:hypothetical protein
MVTFLRMAHRGTIGANLPGGESHMSKRQPSYAQLTHGVVQQSPEPLTLGKIIAAVDAIRPITTKNPKNTIRGAISNSYMIVSTGDGRYGLKPRLINGAVLRHTLSEAELVEKVLHWDVDLKDALWPSFHAKLRYNDRSPAKVALPNDTVTEMPLEFFGHRVWGSYPTPTFWIWLKTTGARPGDHLLYDRRPTGGSPAFPSNRQRRTVVRADV